MPPCSSRSRESLGLRSRPWRKALHRCRGRPRPDALRACPALHPWRKGPAVTTAQRRGDRVAPPFCRRSRRASAGRCSGVPSAVPAIAAATSLRCWWMIGATAPPRCPARPTWTHTR
eukprot:scaffold29_cov251-Pinguiococcus_pyrenoidosus.AAC.52